MWIMIAGPYRAGTSDPEQWHRNLMVLNQAAYDVFARGHVPIIGVNMALPVIEASGERAYDEIMMPLSLRLTERCDAILRIGGASGGADKEVARFIERGLPVYRAIDEVPDSGE